MGYRHGINNSINKVKTKTTIVFTALALILAGGGLPLAFLGTANALPAPQVIYDALPSVNPATNYPSQPFQAQQTNEFGDYVHLAGTARQLNTITVTMSDWALASTPANVAFCSSISNNCDSTGFNWPITVNVYANTLTNDVPNHLLGTKTVTTHIPWRPAGDPSCATTSNGYGWKVGTTCFDYSGIAANATFDLSNLNLTLPNDVIIGFVYNTQTYGPSPTGIDGPYNSLNIAVPPNDPVTVGTDDSADAVFWNTNTVGYYSNQNCTGGTFCLDTSWTPYGTVALQVTARPALTVQPTNKEQCKKDGWKEFNNPSFKNQGQCIDWVEAVGNGRLTMSGPNQKIEFNIANTDKHGGDRDRGDHDRSDRDNNTVEYWNYEYNGGVLHYKADVMCAYVNPQTNEARFMFQIPSGHDGLSGLYVVAYVKDVKGKHTPDLYGHTATSDLATATQWCQTGEGFSPILYTVTGGKVEIN